MMDERPVCFTCFHAPINMLRAISNPRFVKCKHLINDLTGFFGLMQDGKAPFDPVPAHPSAYLRPEYDIKNGVPSLRALAAPPSTPVLDVVHPAPPAYSPPRPARANSDYATPARPHSKSRARVKLQINGQPKLSAQERHTKRKRKRGGRRVEKPVKVMKIKAALHVPASPSSDLEAAAPPALSKSDAVAAAAEEEEPPFADLFMRSFALVAKAFTLQREEKKQRASVPAPVPAPAPAPADAPAPAPASVRVADAAVVDRVFPVVADADCDSCGMDHLEITYTDVGGLCSACFQDNYVAIATHSGVIEYYKR